jgi:uncharacterized membrane protein
MSDKRKKVIAVVLAVCALAILGIGGWQAWVRVPPEMPETVDQVEALFDSPRYQRLSDAEKRPYQERVNEMWGQLSKDERDRLRSFLDTNPDARQEAQDSMQQAMRTMYKTQIIGQDKAARDAAMDGFIAMGEAQRGNRGAQDPNREKTAEELEREAEGRRRMWEMLDKGDPQNIGYMSEFMKLMQERREERGMPPL